MESKSSKTLEPLIFPNVPQDNISEILSFVPAKDLCRFKCVSPEWLDLISSTKFIKKHLKNCRRADKDMKLLRTSHDIIPDPYDLSTDAFTLTIGSCLSIVGSCDGLVLLINCEMSLVVVNPLTISFIKLPEQGDVDTKVRPFPYTSFYGFGYDKSSDRYKVVSIFSLEENSTENVVCVYTIGTASWRRINSGTASWLRIENNSPDPPQKHDLSHGLLFNGSLHWFVCMGTISNHNPVIVSFSLEDETFRNIEVPEIVDPNDDFYQIGTFRDHLSLYLLFDSMYHYHANIWVMEEYGVKESWKMYEFSIPIASLQWKHLRGFISREESFPIGPEGRDKLLVYHPKDEWARYSILHRVPLMMAGTFIQTLVSPHMETE